MTDVISDTCAEFVETLKEYRRQLLDELLDAADEIGAHRDSCDGNSDWRFSDLLQWDERASWTLGEWDIVEDEATEYLLPEHVLDVMGWLATKQGRIAADKVFSSLESGLPKQVVKAAKNEIEWKPELFTVVSDAVCSALDHRYQHMEKESGDNFFEYRGHSILEAEFWPMLTSEMSAEIAVRIDALVNQSWTALVPVEHAFARFEELTELPLFPFKLLNVVDEPNRDDMTATEVTDERRDEQFEEDASGELGGESVENDRFVARFVAALRRSNCVQVMDSDEVDDSYANLASHLRDETNGLIPGTPLLVVPCSNGSALDGARFLRRKLSKWMHFLSFCQLAYDVQVPSPADNSSTASKPNRRSLDNYLELFSSEVKEEDLFGGPPIDNTADLELGTGSIGLPELGLPPFTTASVAPALQEVPCIALAMKRETGGQARIWNILASPNEASHSLNIREYGRQLQNLSRRFETVEDRSYDPATFLKLWGDHLVPILKLKQSQYSIFIGKDLIEAIESAISLVARCRHRDPGELRLFAIIASETLLNPFNDQNDGESNLSRFKKFGSALSRISQNELDALYRERNKIVHASQLHGESDVLEMRSTAFQLFLKCLNSITKWASIQMHKKQRCDKYSFREFYKSSL